MRTPNVGVFGKEEPITEVLKKSEAKFGDWTDEQLEDFRFSHGSCSAFG